MRIPEDFELEFRWCNGCLDTTLSPNIERFRDVELRTELRGRFESVSNSKCCLAISLDMLIPRNIQSELRCLQEDTMKLHIHWGLLNSKHPNQEELRPIIQLQIIGCEIVFFYF